ncbi:MAG: hypothetical protein HC800_11935 [Phormidesmis sp. RL_2_1]|nr:hypothetical protein [Phormidesmis sp. RL_2_1]
MSEVHRRRSKGDLDRCDCLAYSYEDWSLAQITQPCFERNRELYLGKSAQRLDVLILRDPFNLFASRLKQGFIATKAKRMSMVAMWLQYAKEFVGESNYLTNHLVCISYNRWFVDASYRAQLAEHLGLTFSDLGREKVCGMGGGSSFDGTDFSGRAAEMNVLNRWQKLADVPAFRQLFENEAVWHYSHQIFGELPGTARLRDH